MRLFSHPLNFFLFYLIYFYTRGITPQLRFFKFSDFLNCLFQSHATYYSNFWNSFEEKLIWLLYFILDFKTKQYHCFKTSSGLSKSALRLVNLIYYSKFKFNLMGPIPLPSLWVSSCFSLLLSWFYQLSGNKYSF